MNSGRYLYYFDLLDSGSVIEAQAAKPGSQPNSSSKSSNLDKISVEEFLPVEKQSSRRSVPMSPQRNKTPIESTRAQTMSQYDMLDASDHI